MNKFRHNQKIKLLAQILKSLRIYKQCKENLFSNNNKNPL